MRVSVNRFSSGALLIYLFTRFLSSFLANYFWFVLEGIQGYGLSCLLALRHPLPDSSFHDWVFFLGKIWLLGQEIPAWLEDLYRQMFYMMLARSSKNRLLALLPYSLPALHCCWLAVIETLPKALPQHLQELRDLPVLHQRVRLGGSSNTIMYGNWGDAN